MLVVATSILGIPTLLTAEPNLPLYTAADTICDLLSDASDPVRAQYARLLAQNIPVSTPIDYGQEDRANLFQENSPLRCVLITQGGLLRQLCHSYSHLSAFIKKVRLAFNDESQQGGKAGFTVIGANLPCSCLQCLTGDQEQTKAGTGGEKLQEALVDQLAHKAIGFLGGSKPHLPSSMLFSLFKALRTAQVSNLPSDRDSPFDLLQYLCDSLAPLLLTRYGLGSRRNGTHCRRHFTPHPSTFSPLPSGHLLHPGGHELSSSSTLLGTDCTEATPPMPIALTVLEIVQ